MSISGSGLGGSLGDGEAAALIAGEELLRRDTIPDENQKVTCFSCDQQMVGVYCHACGQRNDDYRRSIFALIVETFGSVFSLENRMWRTWLSLIARPGKASREFSDGKRTLWTSPVRIYLAMSIILFGYMSITETRIFSVRTDIVVKSGVTGDVATLEDQSVKLVPIVGFFKRQAVLDELNADLDFKRVSRLLEGTPKQVFIFDETSPSLGASLKNADLEALGLWPDTDKTSLTQDEEGTDVDSNALRNEALSAYDEKVEDAVDVYNGVLGLTASPETIINRIRKAEKDGVAFDLSNELNPSLNEAGRTSTLESLAILDEQLDKIGLSRSDLHILPDENRRGFTLNLGEANMNGITFSKTDVQRIFLQVLKNPAVLNEGVSKYLPRIMFLMMPFAAIIGMVFIRSKKNALLYDHLVHAAYIHAVTFGFLLVLILLTQWTPLNPSNGVFIIGILIYLPLSAKRMFNRGWFKTFLASYSIAFNYGLVLFFILLLLTVQSVVAQANMISQI